MPLGQKIDTIIVWLLCTVLFALLPLLAERIKGKTSSWQDFWGDGQILLITAAIGSESLGEIILSLNKNANFPASMMAANIIFIFMAAICYPDFSDAYGRKRFIIRTDFFSISLLCFSLVLSISSKMFLLSAQ
jgi:hypothetical protein